MAEISEELKKEVQEILDRERWQGYVSGKVEGALNVLYALDLSKEKRLELLSKAVGISHTTAEGFLEPREIEERIYKNENLSDEEKDALDALMSNKTMKDEIEMQREIGKQLFLVSIIHYESDFVRKWGYSFLSRDKLVAWTSTAKEELDHFIDVCGALDPYNMAAEAAKECCRKEPFKSERDAYCFVLFTYYRMGDLFASTMNIDKFEDYCKKFSEHNYKSYSEKYKEYPVAESYSTPEIFEKVMSFYIRYLVTIIKGAISEGFAWDVIASMTRIDISAERYNSLVIAFAEESVDEG